MKIKSKISIVLLILLGFTLTGCIHVNRQFKDTRNAILSNVDAEFERDIEFGLGPVGLTLARAVVSIAADEEHADEARIALSSVSEVQVGVYKITGRNSNLSMSNFNDVTENLKDAGWVPIVRSSQDGELNMVFVQDDYESLNNIYVIALDHDELAIVNVSGRLERLVALGLREGKLDFEHNGHNPN